MPYLPRYYVPDDVPQPKLEHKRIRGDGADVESELNRLGEDGWEIVAADDGWIYLSRVKNEA